MPSTVRIGDDAKERMRRLQEAWHRSRGQRPTQEELLDRCLAYLERHRSEFLSEAAWRPLDQEEIDRLRGLQVASGDTGDYDVDEVVYG